MRTEDRHLNGVKNGDELRAAYEENQAGVVKAMTQFSQSRALFDALNKVQESLDQAEGDDEFILAQKKRAVENSLRGMKLGGVGLEGETKEKFNEIKMRLAELSTKFGNHLMDATKAYGLVIEDAEELASVPASAKAMWANAYKMYLTSEGKEEEAEKVDAEKGPWRVTLDGPSYIAALSHIPNRDLREQIYKASITRASEVGDDSRNNVTLIYEILSLKQEMSNILGFSNYAEQSLASKMAPSVESVKQLSELVLEKALPAAEKELAEVTALARSKGGDEYSEENMEKLKPWDATFWSERLKEEKFDLTEEELRPYFALPRVLDGMFGLVERNYVSLLF